MFEKKNKNFPGIFGLDYERKGLIECLKNPGLDTLLVVFFIEIKSLNLFLLMVVFSKEWWPHSF